MHLQLVNTEQMLINIEMMANKMVGGWNQAFGK